MARRVAYGDIIAQAISDADKRYFFEDYTAQARAVMSALASAGLTITPSQPTEAMIEAGKESLTYGAQRPVDLVRNLYIAMIAAKG